MLLTIVCSFMVLLVWRIYLRYHAFQHIPGPGIFKALYHVIRVTDPLQHHLILTEMSRKYGPVMHVSQFNREAIVVSGYHALQEMLVKKGKEFGGRPDGSIAEYVARHKGISGALEADNTWNALRKLSQHHFYMDGFSELGIQVKQSSKNMLQFWKEKEGAPIDPEPQIKQMILKNMLYIILGVMPEDSDPLISSLEEYTRQALIIYTFNPEWKVLLFDMFPWLRYFRVKPWEMIQEFNKLENDIWKQMKLRSRTNASSANLIDSMMHNHKQSQSQNEVITTNLKEDNIRAAILNIIFAGLVTTMTSFHAAINLFAHNPEIQETIYQEVQEAVGSSKREINLDDRSMMPYTRAAIYELLRYMSPVAESVPHRCVKHSTLMGYAIPEGTILKANLWAVNHDPDLWSDPLEYQPKRFLDEYGEILPSDHPNRKHFMAFGAGARICLAESMALARLFVLITTLLQRFQVKPDDCNTKELTDCLRHAHIGGVLRAPGYKVIFMERGEVNK